VRGAAGSPVAVTHDGPRSDGSSDPREERAVGDGAHDTVPFRGARRTATLFALGWLLVEIAAGFGLRLLRERFDLRYRPLEDFLDADDRAHLRAMLRSGDGWYHRQDALLGWVTRPSGRLSAPGIPVATQNAQGTRALHDYAEHPPADVLRVAAFGDSFVHGDEVGDGEEWAALLERSRPGLEVMNFGVSGYGPDQAFLRWRRDGVRFRPDVVVIGYMTENLLRTQNVFRPFYERGSGFRLSKPRFRLVDDELVLLPNPLATRADLEALLRDPVEVLGQLGHDDAFYAGSGLHSSRLDFLPSVRLLSLVPSALDARRRERDLSASPDGEAFRTTRAILLAFCREVRESGSTPLVSVFPNESDLQALRRGGARSWRPLVEDLRRGGCPTVDLADRFGSDGAAIPLRELFGRWHYSATGNRIAAAGIGEAVDALRPGRPGRRGTRHGVADAQRASAPGRVGDHGAQPRSAGPPPREDDPAGAAERNRVLDSIVWKGSFGVAMRR